MKRLFIPAYGFLIPLLLFFLPANHPVQQKGVAGGPDDSVYSIYLSFDDGPLEGSEDINDAVKKEDIKINVFIVGMHVLSNPRMSRFYELYESNPYIEVGNHSYSHAHDHYKEYYEKPDSVLEDFVKNQGEFHIQHKLARLPGRNMWRIQR
jgi:peptidoglycan-N-acetylglucosamine deacetylase